MNLCGPYCLYTICRMFGMNTDFETIKRLTGYARRGTSLLDISKAATGLKLYTKGFSSAVRDLPRVPVPWIAHIQARGRQHFVVVMCCTEEAITIINPTNSMKPVHHVSVDAFANAWTGKGLIVSKTPITLPGFNSDVYCRLRSLLIVGSPVLVVLSCIILGLRLLRNRKAKRSTALLILLFLVHAGVAGCSPKPGQSSSGLVFQSEEKDLGWLMVEGNSTPVEVPFPFRVEGRNSVRILGVRPSCTCTVAPIEKREYKPGESGVLRATLHLKPDIGIHVMKLEVLVEKANKPILLRATASTYFNLTVPLNRIDFGEADQSVCKTKILRVASCEIPGRKSFRVLQARTTLEHLSVSVGPKETIAQKDSAILTEQIVTATLMPERPVGDFRGDIFLDTDCPGKEHIRIEVEGEVVGGIRPRPGSFFFGRVRKGETKTSSLLLRSVHGLPIERVEAKSGLPGVALRWERGDNKGEVKLIASLLPQASAPGSLNGTVRATVIYGDKKEELTLPLYALVAQ